MLWIPFQASSAASIVFLYISNPVSYSLITGNAIDFSPLVTLIGSVIGEVIGFAIYSLKSAKENSEGGIIYDSVFRNKENVNEDIEG